MIFGLYLQIELYVRSSRSSDRVLPLSLLMPSPAVFCVFSRHSLILLRVVLALAQVFLTVVLQLLSFAQRA